MAAIDLYRKANKHTEVARLLVELGRASASTKVQPLRVKKLYVLAALEARSTFASLVYVARGSCVDAWYFLAKKTFEISFCKRASKGL